MTQDSHDNPMDVRPGTALNLMEVDPALRQMRFQVEWMMGQDAQDYEIDLSCFLLDMSGQTRKDSDFIFYNNPQSASMAVKHGGDAVSHNGMSEYIDFDFTQLSYEVADILIVLSLHDGDQKDQSFNRLIQLNWRIDNLETTSTVSAGQFSPQQCTGTLIRLVDLARNSNQWAVKPDGSGSEGGLAEIAKSKGLLITG